jgi:hypothetical protein
LILEISHWIWNRKFEKIHRPFSKQFGAVWVYGTKNKNLRYTETSSFAKISRI